MVFTYFYFLLYLPFIKQSLAEALAPHWDNTESTYISGCKHVFRNIRLEREDIYHYFHTIRVNFEDYLRRPDTKQEFLATWQQDYNEIAEDMRDDEETKAEIHHRVMVSGMHTPTPFPPHPTHTPMIQVREEFLAKIIMILLKI